MWCRCPFLGHYPIRIKYECKNCNKYDVQHTEYKFMAPHTRKDPELQMLVILPSKFTHMNVFPPNHNIVKDKPSCSPKFKNKSDILSSRHDRHIKILKHRLKTLQYNLCPPGTSLSYFLSQQEKETNSLKAQIQHLKYSILEP